MGKHCQPINDNDGSDIWTGKTCPIGKYMMAVLISSFSFDDLLWAKSVRGTSPNKLLKGWTIIRKNPICSA